MKTNKMKTKRGQKEQNEKGADKVHPLRASRAACAEKCCDIFMLTCLRVPESLFGFPVEVAELSTAMSNSATSGEASSACFHRLRLSLLLLPFSLFACVVALA